VARVIDTRRSRLLLVALVLSHLVVISHQVDGGGGASLLERAILTAVAPFQNAVAWTVGGVSSAWHGYVDLRGVRDRNLRLEERVAVLETLLQEKQDLAREAEHLREVLALREVLPLETIPAEVVTRDGLPWFRTVVLDKGRESGVRLEAPVISPTGVVGRVIAVGPHAAKVQLLLDQQSGVGVLIERSRVTGVVSGQVGFADSDATDLVLKYVPALADVVVGDLVVTSGLDRVYPKGLVVGRVRTVSAGSGLFKEIAVSPSARFDRLEHVLVVNDRKAPLDLDESVQRSANGGPSQ
jgi:rod shape-determining protein MreC